MAGEVVKDGDVPSVTGDYDNAAMEVELPCMVDKNVVKENHILMENTIGLGSYPPLPTRVTSAGNAPSKSSYANVIGKPSRKKLNIHTLFTPRDDIPFLLTMLGTLRKWHLDENLLKEDGSIVPVLSFARVMIELQAYVKLKENIIVAMPKITREGHYTCNLHVEYEWKPLRCSSCKVFGHIHKECLKHTSAGEKKTVKKPSQASRGVPVGPKMAFKPQKEYRPITKKPNTSLSGN
nr:hypothetical protein [Tanacetum cinerariifolium]